MTTTAIAETARAKTGAVEEPTDERHTDGGGHPLPSGTKAPDFRLRSTPDQWVNLSDFRGRRVVLAFYPADWSPVCGDQMTLYNEMLGEFAEFDAELAGIS